MPPEPIYIADFEKLVPDQDRKVVLSSSRLVFQNFGPARGAIIQKANNVVGRAWDPHFTGRDLEFGKTAADWLKNQWYDNCDIRGPGWDFKLLLWLDCVGMDRDGDFLIILTDGDYPLMQRVMANRIGQRSAGGGYGQFSSTSLVNSGPFQGARISHGVIRDRFDRVLGYRVLGNTVEDDQDIPANRCIFGMDPTWSDQIRGEPAAANALKFIRGSMLSHEWEQMAQLMVSSIGLVEYNETGGPDIDDPTLIPSAKDGDGKAIGPDTQLMAGGTIRYIRANSGGKIEQVKHDRPGDMWDSYQDRVVRILATGMDWPFELMWKSSDVNAALVRNIQERARMSVEDRQDCLRKIAQRVVRWAVAKAIKSGILPTPKFTDDWWRWDFGMPRKFSIDPGKEAAQRREDFKIGIKNRRGIYREEGVDPEQMDDERIEEVFQRELKITAAEGKYGIKPDRRLFYMLNPNDIAPPLDDGEEPDPADPSKKKDPAE